jgi:hypothetical protein
MKQKPILAFLAVTAIVMASAEGALVAQWNLGEDDPGAVAGNIGNVTTLDAVDSFGRTRLGDPTYSTTVAPGGSTLSMEFDGAGDYYTGSAPTIDLTKDFSYAFGASVTAWNSFNFFASLGSNFGGIAVVQTGGTVKIFFPGVGAGTGDFTPTFGQWYHYQVDYTYNAGSPVTTLSVDGNVVSTRTGNPRNDKIDDYFTIGGNSRVAAGGSTNPADFEGSFNGFIDHVTFTVIPEPGSLALLGLGGLLALRRRRRS